MLDTLRHKKRKLWAFLGWSPRGRATTIYPEDVMITSYPRSGNTWKTQLDDTGKQSIEHAWPHLMAQLGYL